MHKGGIQLITICNHRKLEINYQQGTGFINYGTTTQWNTTKALCTDMEYTLRYIATVLASQLS